MGIGRDKRKLIKALEYYADPRVYTNISVGSPFVMLDKGERAREALKNVVREDEVCNVNNNRRELDDGRRIRPVCS